jgi:ABC-type Fe3+-hydroxamate transport system substrate-binding protein
MPSKKIYTDQMGREVHIPAIPKRIVSVVPSQTELLFDLGLAGKLLA